MALRFRPLAAESLGVRSMALRVETPDLAITIDPGAAIPPLRGGLPAHPVEINTLAQRWQAILQSLQTSQAAVITHYHYDHLNPDQPWYYRGLQVFLKDPDHATNRTQRRRGRHFWERLRPYARHLAVADGQRVRFGNTEVLFSEPVRHGPGERLGRVVQVAVIHGGDRLVFTSDVQGPCLEEHLDFVREVRPTALYLDGPPTYLDGFPRWALEATIAHLAWILETLRPEVVLLDHHSLRRPDWRRFYEKGLGPLARRLLSAADYLGVPETLYEARRRELFYGSPPEV